MTGTKTLLAGAVIAGVLLAPLAARADYEGWIEAEFTGVSPYESVQIKSTLGTPWVVAGVYHWQQAAPEDRRFWTFCIEPTIWLNRHVTRFDVWHLDQVVDDTVADYVEELWYEKVIAPSTPLFNPYGSSDADERNAAAFQIAVWEFMHENETDGSGNPIYSLYSGRFQMLNGPWGLKALSQGWINETVDATGPAGDVTLWAMTNPCTQDQAVLGGSLQVVPLPAAVWGGMVLLGGMGGFAAVRRRLRRG